MKTILKLSLAVLVAMTTMSTYASDGDFLLNVKKGSGKEISFSVNNIEKAYITIYDKDYNLIYSEAATGNGGITKTYSLEEFPEGVYLLVVETNLKKVTHKIEISDETTTLSKNSVTDVYKGELKMKNHGVATTN